jgi:peptide/nickel transport system permease protein
MREVDDPIDAAPDSTRQDLAEVAPGAAVEAIGLAAEAAPVETAEEVQQARTKKLGVFGWLAIVWLALVVLMALVPTLFPVPAVDERFREPIISDSFGPQGSHFLGFDDSGFDMASKVVYGTRASAIVSVGAVTFGLVLGGALGLIAGYFRGRLDAVLTSAFNVMLAIPQVVLALTLATVFASGEDVSYARRVLVVTFAIGIVSVPILGRITRANALAWSQREFVMAAKVLGTRTPRILWREVLPNVMPAMFSIALLAVAVAIVVEGGLALLGVGVPASIDSPSWGNLIASGRSQMLLGKPWVVFAPSIAIFLTVLSLNYLGDVVRARFDVRESLL